MAQMILTAVGSAFGGPIGAAIGSAIGGAIDQKLFGPKVKGPRPADLSAPKLVYGSELPRLAGTNIAAGYVPFISRKRAHEETVDTKGSSEQTVGFTYTCDILVMLGVHDQDPVWKGIAITRAWVNGELVYSARAGATPGTGAANAEAPWDDLEFCDGGPTQMPWAIQEVERGVGQVPAYRGRNTVRLTNVRLGNSTVPPQMKFEIITAGTPGAGRVIALINANDSVGDLTVDDDSSYHHTVTLTNVEQGANAAFGATGLSVLATVDSFGWRISGVSIPFTSATPLSLESRQYVGRDTDIGVEWMSVDLGGGNRIGCGIGDATSPDEKFLYINLFDQTFETTRVSPPEFPVAFGGYPEVFLGYDGSGTARLYVGGSMVLDAEYSGSLPAITQISEMRGMYSGNGNIGLANGDFASDGYRYTVQVLRHSSNYSPPTTEPTDDEGSVWTPGTVTLGAIVAAESRRCGIPDELVDTSDIDAIPIRGYPSAGGARGALEQLCRLKHVGLVQDSALRFIERGGTSEATLAYDVVGAGFDSAAEEPIDQDIGSDEEIPRKLSLTYVSTEADGDPDTKTGDRGTGSQKRVATEETALLLTPAEAKDLADQLVAAMRVEGTAFKLAVSEAHVAHQPTSVVTLTDGDGITYRARITGEDWTLGVHQWELALDDASIYSQAGFASSDREAGISIPTPPEVTLRVLDIPTLRSQDDGPGVYVAVTATGRFRGCYIHRSTDDVTYTQVGDPISTRATAGECDSELPPFEGWGWDNTSVLTVTLDDGAGGTLASATKTAIEANRTLNLACVGAHGRWELVQFATATLLTGSTYELRGFLRNLFGTEWANGLHADADDFVLLQPSGMARVTGSVADLGQTRHYKAVRPGQSVSSVAAVSIVCELQSLMPYAPVDVWNDAGTVRWNRRSRLEGAIGIDPPLGEASERYDAELYDGVTLEESAAALTAPNWTPAGDPSGLTARVYQLSDLVGRGHVAEKELT